MVVRRGNVKLTVKNYTANLNCCSLRTSVSRAWKSMDNRATIEFTDSMPDKIVRISFRASTQSLVISRGEIRLIRTRHGNNGRISRCVHRDNSRMFTFCIAVNTRGEMLVLESIFVLLFITACHDSECMYAAIFYCSAMFSSKRHKSAPLC